MLKCKMSAILKRHCYHSNGYDVIFVNNFQLLEDCSIYLVQFLSSNNVFCEALETVARGRETHGTRIHVTKAKSFHLRDRLNAMSQVTK